MHFARLWEIMLKDSLQTEGIVYMFRLKRDLCLCMHIISLPHQQIENFQTFFLSTTTKENITSDTTKPTVTEC